MKHLRRIILILSALILVGVALYAFLYSTTPSVLNAIPSVVPPPSEIDFANTTFKGSKRLEEKNTDEAEMQSFAVLPDGSRLTLEVARTSAERRQGLSGRKALPNNTGLLFVSQPLVQSFWMKDMLFSIDIIWIENETIVGIETNVPFTQETPQPIYTSPLPVNRVIEVPAGFAEAHQLKVGETLDIFVF